MAVNWPPSFVMNTFERHRILLLRRQRARRLRRKVTLISLSCILTISGWALLSLVSPAEIAPPPPSRVAADLVQQFFRISAGTADGVYHRLAPSYADEYRREALALFPPLREQLLQNGSGAEIWPLAWNIGVGNADKSSLRRFDVLLIGNDSRLGKVRGRADALQLVSFDVEQGRVDITGIPRGTPVNLGYDSAQSNIIANTLAAKGRGELLRQVARLTGRDSLKYWIEIGFSDAMGVLELLGFEHPAGELQSLRRRQGYRYGDHTRSYNQARFMRTALLRLLPLLGESTGGIVIGQGLRLVRSNLSFGQCRGMALLLLDAGIAQEHGRVYATVCSPFARHLADDAGATRADAKRLAMSGNAAERRLSNALAGSSRAKPDQVIHLLWTMFQQHAWLQVQDRLRRRELRDAMAVRLTKAFAANGNKHACRVISNTIEAEEAVFYTNNAAPR